MREQSGEAATRPAAFLVLAGLVGLNVLNYVDRTLLQSFMVDIKRDLDLTYLQFSLLAGLMFSGAYAIAALFSGSFADRHSRVRIIAGGLALWSALTAASGLVRNFWQMAVVRGFVGVGEAALQPSALSLLYDIFPATRRALVIAVYYLGIPIGMGASMLIASGLGGTLGWRGAFFVLGGFGVVAAIAVMRFRDPPRRGVPAEPVRMRQHLGGFLGDLARNRPLQFVYLGSFFALLGQGGLQLDQSWLVQERGFTVQEAQRAMGFVIMGGGAVGSLLGGFGSDWLEQRMRYGRLVFVGVIILSATPLLIAYRLVESQTVLFYGLGAFVAGSSLLVFSPVLASAQALTRPDTRAMAVGAMMLVNTLLGTSLGKALAGVLMDQLTAAGVEEPLTRALVIGSLPMAPAGLCFLVAAWLARGRKPQDASAATAPTPSVAP